jgi:hypothetical protein
VEGRLEPVFMLQNSLYKRFRVGQFSHHNRPIASKKKTILVEEYMTVWGVENGRRG